MTKQETVERLKSIKSLVDKYDDVVALRAAIKALEQEPCGDAISRQAAIEKIHWLGLDNDTAIKCDLAIRALSPVNPQEPKTGHWIAQDIYNCHTDFMCSKCGYIHSFMHLYGQPTADYTYCPNCGAKMESEE